MSKSKTNYKGTFVSARAQDLRVEYKLSHCEVLLLCYVQAWIKSSGGCFASNKLIGRHLRLDGNFVSDLISKLKKKNMLTLQWDTGKRRNLVLTKRTLDRLNDEL